MGELRIYGPPGTGKSTRLATREIPDAVKAYGPDKVLVTSFTRAAAKEIAGKKSVDTGETVPLDSRNIGTLHAFCHRLFGAPVIAEMRLKEWNAFAPKYAMEGGDNRLDLDEMGGVESGGNSSNGAELLGQVNILRAKMINPKVWPVQLQTFYQKWEAFKDENGYFDYTDLIDKARKSFPFAPGHPDVMFVDEGQDFTKLQMSLIRSWATQMRWLVICADDDQTIYGFTGATPDTVLYPEIDDKYKRILDQSYRVPRNILAHAMALIRKVKHRQEKKYKPRPADGIIRKIRGTFTNTDKIIVEITKQIQQDRDVMVLASCSYMLEPLRQKLLSIGIPFHNPYRYKRGDWNPLKQSTKRITTARDIVYNFFAKGDDGKYWTVPQLITWLQAIRTGENGLIRKKGKLGIAALKKAVESNADGLETSREVLQQLLSPAAIEPALNRDRAWFREQLLTKRGKSVEFPLTVSAKLGIEALRDDPKVILGTIHSVKGGEATCVILFPDISYRAYNEIAKQDKNNEAIDAIRRLFYVGMTRAYDELIIADPNTSRNGKKMAVQLWDQLVETKRIEAAMAAAGTAKGRS